MNYNRDFRLMQDPRCCVLAKPGEESVGDAVRKRVIEQQRDDDERYTLYHLINF